MAQQFPPCSRKLLPLSSFSPQEAALGLLQPFPSQEQGQLEQPVAVALLCKGMGCRAVGATAVPFTWILAKQSLQREK